MRLRRRAAALFIFALSQREARFIPLDACDCACVHRENRLVSSPAGEFRVYRMKLRRKRLDNARGSEREKRRFGSEERFYARWQ